MAKEKMKLQFKCSKCNNLFDLDKDLTREDNNIPLYEFIMKNGLSFCPKCRKLKPKKCDSIFICKNCGKKHTCEGWI